MKHTYTMVSLLLFTAQISGMNYNLCTTNDDEQRYIVSTQLKLDHKNQNIVCDTAITYRENKITEYKKCFLANIACSAAGLFMFCSTYHTPYIQWNISSLIFGSGLSFFSGHKLFDILTLYSEVALLSKNQKGVYDQHYIKHMIRNDIYNSTDSMTIENSSNNDRQQQYELYNAEKQRTVPWNTKNPDFIKKLYSQKYNTRSWTLRTVTIGDSQNEMGIV